MRLSRSVILAPVTASDRVLVVQPLSGQAALVGREEAEALRRLATGCVLPASLPEETLRDARFVVESDEEDEALRAGAVSEWAAEAARTPTQLVVVPSFGCNLACTYCYQEPFDPSGGGLMAPQVVDALFAYVDRHHATEEPRPYLTLFGGEPLRDTPAHHDRVGRFLAGASARGLEVAVVTNGHDLERSCPRSRQGR
jgi:uncharacterized protein